VGHPLVVYAGQIEVPFRTEAVVDIERHGDALIPGPRHLDADGTIVDDVARRGAAEADPAAEWRTHLAQQQLAAARPSARRIDAKPALISGRPNDPTKSLSEQ
jgi:hypothetical protein